MEKKLEVSRQGWDYGRNDLLVDGADARPLIMSNRRRKGPDLRLLNPKTSFLLLGLEFRSNKKEAGEQMGVM